MSIRENIDRWIFASISKHFADRITDVTFRIEGQPYVSTLTPSNYIELRMTGPAYNKFSRYKHRFDLIINVLINVIRDQNTHRIFQLCGLVESALTTCIEVKKYGEQLEDNPLTTVGSLIQVRNADRLVDTSHFGPISVESQIMQSTVESYYRLNYVGDINN